MQGVSKRYGGVRALQDADLVVEAGRIHAVLGENGAGKSTMVKILAAGLLVPLAVWTGVAVTAAPEGRLDAEKIGAAAGTRATTAKDGVVRIGWARTDVAVRVDGMPLKPFAGLGSWAAFTPAPHGAMVMGDTVVFQDEVSPAMDAAFAGGLEVTALHNHFFYDEPKVYFMHIGGTGEPEKLAEAVKNVSDAIKKVRAKEAQPVPVAPVGGRVREAARRPVGVHVDGHRASYSALTPAFGMISFHESRTSCMCASLIDVRRSRSTSSCSVVKYFSIVVVT